MKLQLTEAEVTHLRKVLAWMRCEYMLDDDMQRGYAEAAKQLVDYGHASEEIAKELLSEKAEQIKHVPKYVRHGVKMLTESVREHDRHRGDVVDTKMRTVERIGESIAESNQIEAKNEN